MIAPDNSLPEIVPEFKWNQINRAIRSKEAFYIITQQQKLQEHSKI